MMICKHRIVDKCKKDGRPCIFSEKCFEPEEQKPITNADHIRSMSDEELMQFFCKEILCKKFLIDACYKICPVRKQCSPGHNGILEWLKQPWKENTDG